MSQSKQYSHALLSVFGALTGGLMKEDDYGSYFGGVAVKFGNIGWQMPGLALTFLIMILGKKER